MTLAASIQPGSRCTLHGRHGASVANSVLSYWPEVSRLYFREKSACSGLESVTVNTPIRRYADRCVYADTPIRRSVCLRRHAVTPIGVFAPIRRYADRCVYADTPIRRSVCLRRYADTPISVFYACRCAACRHAHSAPMAVTLIAHVSAPMRRYADRCMCLH